MARRNSDVVVSATLALVVAALSLAGVLPRSEGLGLVLVLPLVTVCPGATFLAALGAERMEPLTRTAAVLTLSLAWTLLLGLLLHATPVGLRASSFATALAVVVLTQTLIAIYRRRDAPSEPVSLQARTDSMEPEPVGPRLLFALAGALTVAAVALSVWGARNVGRPTFTQLWAVPNAGGAAIRVGVENFEGQPMTYDLRLQVGAETVRVWRALSVAPEQAWEETVALPSSAGPVELVLLRSDRPGEVYREVRVWPRFAVSTRPF
jgi:uncharacterized membrane protein